MKELQTLNGGYQRHMDYLLTLQAEVMGVQNALFKNLGHDLVLSGCEVTNHHNGRVSIEPGVVYVGGEIVRFAGAANVPADGTKALTKGAPVASDPDEFFDGSVKNTYKETFAVVANTDNSAVQIVIRTSLYDLKAFMSDIVQSYGQKGEIKDIYDLDGDFMANFDASGLGVTPRWNGWAIVNGNNGTPNGQGRTRVSAGRIASNGIEYSFEHGAIGGEVQHTLTVPELPSEKKYGGAPQSGYRPAFGSGPNVSWPTAYMDYGGGQGHNNMQPYLAVYSVIKIT